MAVAGDTALATLVVVMKDDEGTDVTSALVADPRVDGLVSWALIQNGTVGDTYDLIFRQTVNYGQTLERYASLVVRNPRNFLTPQVFKYPNNKFQIPVEWARRRPRGNPALSTLLTKAYTSADADETSTYLAGSFVTGTIGVGDIIAGSGVDSRMLEFARSLPMDGSFTNTRRSRCAHPQRKKERGRWEILSVMWQGPCD